MITATMALLKNVTFISIQGFKYKLSKISVISWRSVLLVEETGGSGENYQLVASH
jgi:hypothetical protein